MWGRVLPPVIDRRYSINRRYSIGWRGDTLDWRNEAVAMTGKRLDPARGVGRIAQRIAEPPDGGVNAVLEFHDGVVRPKPLLQFLPRDHFPRVLEQHAQNLNGLAAEWEPEAVLAQFACTQIKLERSELNAMWDRQRSLHGGHRFEGEQPTRGSSSG
jgi:hypothetical protein